MHLFPKRASQNIPERNDQLIGADGLRVQGLPACKGQQAMNERCSATA